MWGSKFGVSVVMEMMEMFVKEFVVKTRVGGDAIAFAGYEVSSVERVVYILLEGGDVYVVILGYVDVGKLMFSG